MPAILDDSLIARLEESVTVDDTEVDDTSDTAMEAVSLPVLLALSSVPTVSDTAMLLESFTSIILKRLDVSEIAIDEDSVAACDTDTDDVSAMETAPVSLPAIALTIGSLIVI